MMSDICSFVTGICIAAVMTHTVVHRLARAMLGPCFGACPPSPRLPPFTHTPQPTQTNAPATHAPTTNPPNPTQ